MSLPRGKEILAERRSKDVVLPISVRANPPAQVTWTRQGRPISAYDPRYRIREDSSLVIVALGDTDAGEYVAIASNGVGASVSASLVLIVYPIMPSARIQLEKSIFKPGDDIEIPCTAGGYPVPYVEWFRFAINSFNKPT